MGRVTIDRRSRIRLNDDIRRVRERHLRAIQLGYPNNEASRLAQSDEPIEPPKRVDRVVTAPAPVAAPEPKPAVSAVSISGQAEAKIEVTPPIIELPPEAITTDIPADWQELPWVSLRRLAAKVSGKSIGSRKNALEAIEAALALRTGGKE